MIETSHPEKKSAFDPLRPLRSGRVAIVGFSETTRAQAPYGDPDVEIWVCNRLGLILEKEGLRWDRHFDPHTLEWSAHHHKPPDWEEYSAWLAKNHGDRPIYLPPGELPAALEQIPNAVAFPLDLVIEVARGRRYFTSAIAYQIGLAIALGAKWIGLYGIDLRDISEYEFQRPCAERLLGLAEGIGIEIYLPEESALLNADGRSPLYGMEVEKGLAADLEKLCSNTAKEHAATLEDLAKKRQEIDDLMHTNFGAQQVALAIAARVGQYRRGGKL